ncbi:MAG: acetyl-coenzyme A synthetase N-terminal domain-containing protein, partial [Acidobacteriota bacterium]
MAGIGEKIDVLTKDIQIYEPSPEVVEAAWVKDYEEMYRKSIENPEQFWAHIAADLDWFKSWDRVLDWNYPWAKWFVGAQCNISYNCLDRHVKSWRKNKLALIWVGEDGTSRAFSYGQLYKQVNRLANAMKALGVGKGDRVTVYLPRIPEQVIAL